MPNKERQEILEDKYYQQGTRKTYNELNTDEQRKRAQFYVERYDALKAEMDAREDTWNNIEKQYKCERDYIDEAPNSFIPVTAPIINGQIASIIDQNIAHKVRGIGPSDHEFAGDGQKIVDLVYRHNRIKQILKPGVGRYLLFGTAWFAIEWDSEALDGFGIPKIRTPQTTKVYVDGNIKDMLQYQKAEYLIEECGFQSIMWARREFGDDKANLLMMNTSTSSFEADTLDDEKFSFNYLKVWHRNNKFGNLQLLEMDDTGFVLRESDPSEPYHTYVYNQYPYIPIGLYCEEGEFHRFGDGKLLYFMQDTINRLYDEVITACKFSAQSRTFIDPAGQVDPDEFDADPGHPIACIDPQRNIHTASSGTLNPVVERLIANIMNEARRATRFSDLMTGVGTGEKITATQAGIQTNQGNTGINDKKGDISDALRFIANYAIGLCMEYWDGGQWMRVSDDKDEFEWIDATQLTKVPTLIPTDDKFRKEWHENNRDKDISEMAKWMEYIPDKDIKNDEGEIVAKAGVPQTKRAEFDIDVSIGEGLPSSPIALYNIMLSLAQLQLIDEQTGMPRPLIGYSQFRKMVEDMLGVPFDDAMEDAKQMNTIGMGQSQQQQGLQRPINMSANIPGANINGTAMGGGAV